MQINSINSISPSFTSYTSNNLADIVARVVEEYRNENGHEEDDDIYSFNDDTINDNNKFDENQEEDQPEDDDEDKEFEFATVQTNQFNSASSPIFDDQINYNGEILPRYPLFDRSLLLDDSNENDAVSDKLNSVTVSTPPQRHSLSKLFREERESVSCSSSESKDLDGVAPETYCVWKPKLESEERCKKSNSTGNTSKRWTLPLPLRNLLSRSNSDGNFNVKKFEKSSKVAGADDEIETADEIKSSKGDNRLRLNLSNKHDGVGLFGNVNGITRNLRPF
ncbi:uncharacterized protein [Rutidosis leptorrhynchoides]|uniref:uncharacterized protein n=1 Tax=Rutidosis leptorrhynchoides TaxID=125765 RepID=UPI003A99EEDE